MADAKEPPLWIVRLNIAFLRLGLAIGSQHLLSIAGRRTGRIRTTPVSIVTLDGGRYVVAAFEDAAWVQNARAAEAGDIARSRRHEPVRITELPVEERGPILRAFLEQVPGGVRFFGMDADPVAVASAAARYPVFRLDASTMSQVDPE